MTSPPQRLFHIFSPPSSTQHSLPTRCQLEALPLTTQRTHKPSDSNSLIFPPHLPPAPLHLLASFNPSSHGGRSPLSPLIPAGGQSLHLDAGSHHVPPTHCAVPHFSPISLVLPMSIQKCSTLSFNKTPSLDPISLPPLSSALPLPPS